MLPGFVYFDLDDTLLDHRSAEQAALVELTARYPALAAADPTQVAATYHDVNVKVWIDYGAGRIDKPAAKRDRFAALFAAFGVDADPVAAGDDYLEAYGNHWDWIDGARTAFAAVAARYPVGILTNGFAEIQRAKLRRFPELEAWSRSVVISEEFGALKPDPALFDHAARKAGVAPGDILYVGDSLRSDVLGGLGAGWRVAWLTIDGSAAPEGTFCFRRWEELLAHLQAPPA